MYIYIYIHIYIYILHILKQLHLNDYKTGFLRLYSGLNEWNDIISLHTTYHRKFAVQTLTYSYNFIQYRCLCQSLLAKYFSTILNYRIENILQSFQTAILSRPKGFYYKINIIFSGFKFQSHRVTK